MQKTEKLKLPIYDTPEIDVFNLQDWNEANKALDGAYKDVLNFREELPKVNANAEIIEAREGAVTLGANVKRISSSLEQNMKHLNGVKIGKLRPFTKPMISFIFDDGYPGIYNDILPIFKSHGYKGAVSIYTKPFDNNLPTKVTMQQLLNYQKVEDWEILSHSKTHPVFDENLSDIVAEYEFNYSKYWFNKHGLNVNGFVMPFDNTEKDYSTLLSKFYDYAFINPYGAVCDYKKSVYNLTRIEISERTLDNLKGLIDTAILNNQWIVFYGHNTTGMVTASNMTLLLDYIQSKNGLIEVLKPIEVMNQFSDMFIQENKIKTIKELDNLELKPNGNIILNPKLYMINGYTSPLYWTYSKTGNVGLGEKGTTPYRTPYVSSSINGDTAIFSTDINVANFKKIIKGEVSSYIYSNYENKTCNIQVDSYKNGVFVSNIINENFSTDFKNYKKQFSVINTTNTIDTFRLILTFTFDGSAYLEFGFSEPAFKIIGNGDANDLKGMSEIKNTSALTVISNSLATTLPFNNTTIDTLSAYDSINDNFKIKESGLYIINSRFTLGSTTLQDIQISIKKNNITLDGTSGVIRYDFTTEVSKQLNYLTYAYLTKDDIISVIVMKNGASNITFSANMQIVKL